MRKAMRASLLVLHMAVPWAKAECRGSSHVAEQQEAP